MTSTITAEYPLRRKDGARVKPPEEKHRKAARDVLRHDKPISKALVAMGVAPKQARKGLQYVQRSNALRVAFQEEAQRIEEDAKKAPLFPSEGAFESLIMNRLQRNIIKGEDRAVASCKLAGSYRKINMWTPEGTVGIIVVTPPSVIQPILPVPEDPE